MHCSMTILSRSLILDLSSAGHWDRYCKGTHSAQSTNQRAVHQTTLKCIHIQIPRTLTFRSTEWKDKWTTHRVTAGTAMTAESAGALSKWNTSSLPIAIESIPSIPINVQNAINSLSGNLIFLSTKSTAHSAGSMSISMSWCHHIQSPLSRAINAIFVSVHSHQCRPGEAIDHGAWPNIVNGGNSGNHQTMQRVQMMMKHTLSTPNRSIHLIPNRTTRHIPRHRIDVIFVDGHFRRCRHGEDTEDIVSAKCIK